MEIQTRTVYKALDIEFANLDSIKSEITDRLGFIIDKVEPRLPPKQALQMLDLLVKNKKQIVELLTVEYNRADNPDMYSDYINILDY